MFFKLTDPVAAVPVGELHQSPRASIRMDRALLCLDCESIFEAEGAQTCPACGSAIAWAIGRSLNRQTAAPAGADGGQAAEAQN